MKAIEVKNLVKSYGETKAIDNISFEVNENELFGFIGPDGAGKTTIFRILTTLIIPDNGKATILGLDSVKNFNELRLMLGYMPGKFSLYQDLSVEENLKFFATIFGTTIEENYYLIKDIYSHIEPFKNRLSGKLSGGMKQKLALSCALIHKPKVLILDEPTTGVDAVSRKEFWQMLKNLQKKGITIVVSTPYMDEASVCDRVALIQKGQIMKIDTPENIISQYDHQLLAIRADELYRLKNDLTKYPECRSAHLFGQEIHYSSQNNSDIEHLTSYIKHNNHSNIEIKPVQPGIEDCFMDLMQLNETLNS
jgi:ABC-type multidrug transport system ATPase subunit